MSPTPLAAPTNASRDDLIDVSVAGDPAHAVHDVELLDCRTGGAAGFGHLLLGVRSLRNVDAVLGNTAAYASVLAVKARLTGHFLAHARAAGVTVVSFALNVSWSGSSGSPQPCSRPIPGTGRSAAEICSRWPTPSPRSSVARSRSWTPGQMIFACTNRAPRLRTRSRKVW